jgi:hypothetical protein
MGWERSVEGRMERIRLLSNRADSNHTRPFLLQTLPLLATY